MWAGNEYVVLRRLHYTLYRKGRSTSTEKKKSREMAGQGFWSQFPLVNVSSVLPSDKSIQTSAFSMVPLVRNLS